MDFDILKRKELRAAARLVGRAFEDYEYFTNYFPDLEERRKVLRKNIAFYKRCGFEVFDEREFAYNGTSKKELETWVKGL